VVVDNIIVGTRPRPFIMTPDSGGLRVSAELSSEICMIDRATDTQGSAGGPAPGFRAEDVTPEGLAITGDGGRALISPGRANRIAVVFVATKEPIAHVLAGRRAWSVALSHDESHAILANGLADDITIVDMATRRPVRSRPVGQVPHAVVIDD
jgi:DNA-binding beta-propeller fold protein YncE